MAKKKTNKHKGKRHKKAAALRPNFSDDRIRTISSIVLLLSALYLLVALGSYLTTWKQDQSEVFRFSWKVLFQPDLVMQNRLGRLGAFVSHSLVYYGFGLASFAFIYILAFEGFRLLSYSDGSAKRYKAWRNTLLFVLLFPVLAATVRSGDAFPWGGAYGSALSYWLKNFLGIVGLYLLLLAIFGAVMVWLFNPKFSDWKSFRLQMPKLRLPQWNFKSIRLPSWMSWPQYSATITDSPKADPVVQTGTLQVSRVETHGANSGDTFEFLQDPPTKRSEPKPKPPENIELETVPVEDSEEARRSREDALHQVRLRVEEENENNLDPYDPKLDLKSYTTPSLDLLEDHSDGKISIDRRELEAKKDQIIETLLNYKIQIVKIRATVGPTVTLYEIVPAPGVRISKIKNLEDDIALSLSALGIRIIAPIPGKGTIGIEVPNKHKQIVSLKEIIRSEKFQSAKMDLPIAVGKTISNEVFVADLAKMPHLLVAGATGQGKSVGINSILVSLLYKKHPSQVKFVLVDPKKVELFPYSKLDKHYLAFLPGQNEPILTDTQKVIYTLNSICVEMDDRYELLKKARARNIKEYNNKFVQRKLNPNNGHRFLPFIVLIIDEFGDLIMTAGKEIELPIARLAQLARAIGIHLILATQRPSVNIITGIIKANFPARLAFKVTSKVDSRTILDAGGADQLIGRGDMLLSVGGNTVRLQGAFIDTPEVERVIDSISNQRGYPEPFYLPEYVGDDAEIGGGSGLKLSDLDGQFEEAARLVVNSQHGSTSMIQRRLKLGYNRAGRIMDQLEALGIVGPSNGSKPREVYIYNEQELEKHLNTIKEST